MAVQINEEQFNDTKVRWFILQTYVGFEDAVKKSLDLKISNLSLQEKIIEIYIPTKKVYKLDKKGQRQEKLEKIYPGYIYVTMLFDTEVAYLVQNTNYISRIAGTGDVAIALEEGYVEKLKENLLQQSELGSKTTTISTFQLSDLVKVIDGPFKDMQGKISGIDEANSTVDVLLTMFERETVVSLDVLAVKKVI